MALNYETLIRAASKRPEQRTATEINDFIFPWLKQSLKKKQGIFQKISDDVIHDICKSIMLERRPKWDVVIRQGEPGDTFYIILQGSVEIYRFEDDDPKPDPLLFDTVTEFPKYDNDPEKREELITQTFGHYVVTLEGNGLAYKELSGFDFGERALITNEARSATIMTITPTDLLVVDREVFNRTLKTAHEKELQEKTEFINRSPLFSSWSPRLKRLVSLSLERGRFSYDSILYKQGTKAEAVYFIWSGEVKITMDPLLHWLQYPNHLPQTDPMRQRALELFLPIIQPTQPSNVHVPSTLSFDGHRESFAIQRRHMTFAEAEEERAQRTVQLALLNTGDVIGLESYVCELSTHINSARCTGPCDLFYILKHNFLRLQKRHGTQGLTERLREMVRLSLQAYPTRIIQLPLFTSLTKKYLLPVNQDEHQHQQNKRSWLLHIHSLHSQTRRQDATAVGKEYPNINSTNSAAITRNSSRHKALRSPAAINYVTNHHIGVGKIEDRLKQWHAQMGENSKTQIRPLTRYNVAQLNENDTLRTLTFNTLETHRSGTVVSSSVPDDGNNSTVQTELISNISNNLKEQRSSPYSTNIPSYSSSVHLPSIRVYSKQEQYEDLRAHLKKAWKDFLKRPIPTVY